MNTPENYLFLSPDGSSVMTIKAEHLPIGMFKDHWNRQRMQVCLCEVCVGLRRALLEAKEKHGVKVENRTMAAEYGGVWIVCHADQSSQDRTVKVKPSELYPLPDSFEVKYTDYSWPSGHEERLAIISPKESSTPKGINEALASGVRCGPARPSTPKADNKITLRLRNDEVWLVEGLNEFPVVRYAGTLDDLKGQHSPLNGETWEAVANVKFEMCPSQIDDQKCYCHPKCKYPRWAILTPVTEKIGVPHIDPDYDPNNKYSKTAHVEGETDIPHPHNTARVVNTYVAIEGESDQDELIKAFITDVFGSPINSIQHPHNPHFETMMERLKSKYTLLPTRMIKKIDKILSHDRH